VLPCLLLWVSIGELRKILQGFFDGNFSRHGARDKLWEVPGKFSVRIAAGSLACLAGIAIAYVWTTRVRLPPTPPAARLPSSARKMLQPSRSDIVDLTVDPKRELSYEVGMQAGATLVYAWSAMPRERLSCEFAGRRMQEASDAHSAFVAQSSGWYRWRWKNPGNRPVSIHLKLSGSYEPGAVPIPPSSLP
jgi:hypothetical protein